MRRQILVGLAAGVAFLVLDGLLNGNPVAQRLYVAYRPIARSSVNALAGSLVDLAYGLVLAALYVTLRGCLPGRRDLSKGVSFGAMVWFLRVVMRVAGEWVVTTVPVSAHVYSLVAGLIQMLLVAGVIALLLPERRPAADGTSGQAAGERRSEGDRHTVRR